MSSPRGNSQDRLKLSEVPLGSTSCVTSLSANGLCRRRLLDVGLVPGARVVPVRRSPMGDPTAYSVKGTLIALRRRDAELVVVEVVRPPGADLGEGSCAPH